MTDPVIHLRVNNAPACGAGNWEGIHADLFKVTCPNCLASRAAALTESPATREDLLAALVGIVALCNAYQGDDTIHFIRELAQFAIDKARL